MILTHSLNSQESIMSLFCHWLNASHIMSLGLGFSLFSFLLLLNILISITFCFLSLFLVLSFFQTIPYMDIKLDQFNRVLAPWPFKMHLTILLPYLSNGRISITVDLGRLLSNGKISWAFRVHFHVIQLKKCSLIGFCQMFIAANKLLIANSIQDHSQTKIQQLFSVFAILILFLFN